MRYYLLLIVIGWLELSVNFVIFFVNFVIWSFLLIFVNFVLFVNFSTFLSFFTRGPELKSFSVLFYRIDGKPVEFSLKVDELTNLNLLKNMPDVALFNLQFG